MHACKHRPVVQSALQAAQAEVAAGASPDELARMAEVEGALQRAVTDYEVLLRELTNLKAEAHHKDSTITHLERELTSAAQQARTHQCAFLTQLQCKPRHTL